jgi:hypothetical protein
MFKRKVLFGTAVIGILALLIGLSFHPSGLQAQQGTCNGVWVCTDVFNPATGTYTQVCHCCEEGETPAGTPVVITVLPPPSPTPPPGGSVGWCLPNECPPGETRLWLVWYLYNLQIYVPVRPLEPCCGESCPCGEPTEETQPCGPGNGWLRCEEFEATVQAGLPAWYANRRPYPRALVMLPEEVWVSDAAGNPTSALPSTEVWGDPVDPGGDDCGCHPGSCDDDPPPAGTTCDYRLGLRIDPGNEPPTWSFEECGSTTGWQASCTWNRSSWGRPELWGSPPQAGCGFVQPLPAYIVAATVPYWWSFARQWDTWEKVGEDCDCVCQGSPGSDECQGTPGQCTGENEHWERDCDPIYGWKHHGPDWMLLDLRDYGWPTPYMLNPNVQLVPHPPCEPNPPVGAIYVPCIEVQAPIEKRP